MGYWRKDKRGIEVTGRQGRRHRKLLDDLKERRGYSHLKEEALDRAMWRARFGRGFGPVVRQTTKWMNEWINIYFLPPKSEYCLKYPVIKHSQSGLPPLWKTKFSAQDKLTDKIMVGNHYQLTPCNIPKEKHYCSGRFNLFFRQQRRKTRGCKVKISKNFLLLIFLEMPFMSGRVVSSLTSIDGAHYLIH